MDKGTVQVETTRYDYLPRPLRYAFLSLTVTGIAICIFYLFGFSFRGMVMLNYVYYFALYACFSSCSFLIKPARGGMKRVPWYDIVAAALVFVISIYFMLNGWEISEIGWGYPTPFNFVLAIIYGLLLLEGARRISGPFYVGLCVFFAFYPLFAEYMPGFLYGTTSSVQNMVGSHIFGGEGILGLPGKVMGEIIIGFLIFSAILVVTGAGKFFLELAMSVFGGYRGGPAKVSVVGSGLMGSLSGSALSNVVGTGVVTIPIMKKTGYPAVYAGAIEACASTGGVLMPPVMGAVAFVMCTLLEVEYSRVILAAALPSSLYYFGLLMQADAYAAKMGLKGLSREDIPILKKILVSGWPFISVFGVFLYLIFFMGQEELSPFYASVVLVFLAIFVKGPYRMTFKRIPVMLAEIGKLITQAMAVIIPVGFIVSGLTMTGSAASFTAGIVSLAGNNVLLMLLMGAVACYIMGMAGMFISAYIFLAVTFAPAVVQVGHLNVMAVHLFIIYYATLSEITPPVAICAFLGAGVAGASPMKTATRAMRLGVVLYFIPFFFIYNPALILQAPIIETLYHYGWCLIGVLLIASALEGYLLYLGKMRPLERIAIGISGILIAFPELKTDLIGVIIALITIGVRLIRVKTLATSPSVTKKG
ncbi:MAG: TRAP transporter fused permease subunit [Deltaproteobacteria bacterium]|nr:TRAP transporter fused permease subunit [Deltaproteobacteria bacterium]